MMYTTVCDENVTHTFNLQEAIKVAKDYMKAKSTTDKPPVYKRTRKGVTRIAYT